MPTKYFGRLPTPLAVLRAKTLDGLQSSAWSPICSTVVIYLKIRRAQHHDLAKQTSFFGSSTPDSRGKTPSCPRRTSDGIGAVGHDAATARHTLFSWSHLLRMVYTRT